MLNYSLNFLLIAIVTCLMGFVILAVAASFCSVVCLALCLTAAFRQQEKMIRSQEFHINVRSVDVTQG